MKFVCFTYFLSHKLHSKGLEIVENKQKDKKEVDSTVKRFIHC